MLDVIAPVDVRAFADRLIEEAIQQRASDIHIEPTRIGAEVRFRVDGLLSVRERLDVETGRAVALRFLVIAKLLTYRLDLPQEGRAEVGVKSQAREVRVSMMPTTHGPRVAIRLPADFELPASIEALGLPEAVTKSLGEYAMNESGLLLIVGPAGSGKTTTAYALLQTIVSRSPGVSVISLEDPVERDVPGVTQIEITPFGERTYERCLRSLLRQDPQVLMLGEIRDAATASLAVQAALTGHRMICTLHAAGAGGAVARLVEMGVEPYQVTSSLHGVVSQRLVRRSAGVGQYHGRVPIGTFGRIDAAVRAAVLRRADRDELEQLFAERDAIKESAMCLISNGTTDIEELRRAGVCS